MTTQIKQMKEEFKSFPEEQARALTVSTIEKYIETVRNNQCTRTDMYNFEFVLHCFLRTGHGEDYGYDSTQAGYIKGVIQDVMAFFLDDEVSKKFRELYLWDASDMAKAFTSIIRLCEELEETQYEALLEKFDIDTYSTGKLSQKLWDRYIYYLREIELVKLKNETMKKYQGMFE
jgi:hypothetical protein